MADGDPRHAGFETHRCRKMPKGFSLRRHRPDEGRSSFPDGQWALGLRDIDFDYDCECLDSVNVLKGQGMAFCPWCGERLEEDG